MIPVLLSGLASVAAVAAVFLAWVSWSPRTACPECGEPTVAVENGGWAALSSRWTWRRWCAACGWNGLGRRGPDLTEGPVDHASGFRWRGGRSGRAPLFRWANEGDAVASQRAGRTAPAGRAAGGRPRATESAEFTWAVPDDPAGPPAHPSGFRWGGAAGRPGHSPPDAPPVHPSGFTWGDGGPGRSAGPSGGERQGFRWSSSERETEERSGFSWKDRAS